ncbi:SRPBCC domain-containing protein [Proteiniphilum acetatigenes]|uniref:SRPBCC domain-containing protein n=1 Tax=Proteiniphilum acetatigenes TaxID=294710 RepID=UPI000374D304|nr:SRPBCC domain-containing protein [Proteiniphilum acetatigenes]
MAKEIRTEITIQAKREKVWAILTDFENYPNWNPFINFIEGKAEEGNQITVRITPPGGKAMTFKPKIVTRKENQELKWLGTVLFKGLFDGEHRFELKDNADGTVTFVQSEQFRGIFTGLFNPEKTIKGFDEMNNKLKELAEKEEYNR